MVNSRLIDGEKFAWHDSTQYKAEAKAIAKHLRSKRWKARVFKEKASPQSGWRNAWAVYKRRK